MLKKLNLGCGNDYKDGFWNVDNGHCRVDEKVDICQVFPWQDNTFEMIYSRHVLEHIPREKFFQVFREIHRVLAPKGLFQFEVPMAGSDNFWTDPTHTMPFTTRTMDYVIRGKQLRENGLLYGADYEFLELRPPHIDQVQSLYFHLTKD